MIDPTVDQLMPHPRVLALEDDEAIGDNLEIVLADAGYDLSLFRSVAAVRQLTPEELARYVVIIADPHVADSSAGAVEMARLRRKLELHAGLLVLTAGRLDEAKTAVGAVIGPNEPTEFMAKPYDIDELAEAVGRLATVAVRANYPDESSTT